MPIRPYLNGQVFEPAQIQLMGIALNKACEALKLDKSDPLTQIIATEIIALASHGENDPDRLCAGVLVTHQLTAATG